MEIKQEINDLNCCIACLKDESKVKVENTQDTTVINIYTILVQGELHEPEMSSINICNICKQKLLVIRKFQIQCLDSMESLKTKLYIKPEVVFIKEEEIDSDDDVQDTKGEDESTVSEKYNDKESDEDSKEALKTLVEKKVQRKKVIVQVEHNVKKIDGRFYCEQCENSYVKHTELKRHILKRHLGGSTCRYCRNVFVDKKEFEEHMKEEEAFNEKHNIGDSLICCEMCGYTTKFKPALRHHITKFHTPDQPKLICDICGKSYVFRAHFKNHFISNHMEKQFQCNECGKKFATNNNLKLHLRDFHSLEGKVVIKCKYCDKMIKKAYMHNHVRLVHRALKKHICTVCSKGFVRTANLNQHKKIHDPDHYKNNTVTCHKCGMTFESRTEAIKHQRAIHFKALSCNECGLSFKTKPKLTQHHLSTHLDKETLEKNYVFCKFCNEILKPCSMQNHILRKHLDVRKYKCDQCEKICKNSRSLRLHMYKHTGERPFSCNICSKPYTINTALKIHFKNAHDIEHTTEYINKNCTSTS